jgi:hypothetical protein
MKGDSVEILSRSDGIVKFLCLVATFCAMPRHEAAMRMDSLLEATQDRGQLRPMITQLQSMMSLLETKLALGDFTESVADWEVLLPNQLLLPEDHLFWSDVAQLPPRGKMLEVILLLCEMSRLGEEKSIIIKCPDHDTSHN